MELKNQSVVVVGSGVWGNKTAKWLAKNHPQFTITMIGARDFLEALENSYEPKKSADGFFILATTPLLQTKILSLLASFDVLIWAEKPLAVDSAQARILNEIFRESAARVIIDFTWLYSNIWQLTLRAIQNLEEIAEIQITRGGPGPIRSYITPLQDYGSHDLALLISGVDRDFSVIRYEKKCRAEMIISESFEIRLQRGTKVAATYDLELSDRTAVWRIVDIAGNSVNVDFYAGRIETHSNGDTVNEYLSGDLKFDNLGNFLLSLLNCTKEDSNRSLELGIMTQVAIAKIQGTQDNFTRLV